MTHSLLESLVRWDDSSVGMDPSQVSYFQSISAALPVTLYSGFCSLWKDRVFRDRVRLLLCAALADLFSCHCSGWVNGLASGSCLGLQREFLECAFHCFGGIIVKRLQKTVVNFETIFWIITQANICFIISRGTIFQFSALEKCCWARHKNACSNRW